jgi:hypothetical protein
MENSQEENLTANTNKDLGRVDEQETKNTNDVFLADEPGIKLPLDETFEQVKEKIKIMLTSMEEGDEERPLKRSGSTVDSKDILEILKSMKEPKFGVKLDEDVRIDFMQKYYSENVLILGVNRKRIYAFKYNNDKNGVPISYEKITTIHLNMDRGYEYQSRSKLEDGFVFCSSEEIITIKYNPENMTLERNVMLLLSDVREMLDEHEESDIQKEQIYSRMNDETFRFSEARLFLPEDSSYWHLLFSVTSDYSANKEGHIEERPSSLVMLYRFDPIDRNNCGVIKLMQTPGHISNLTLASDTIKTNKFYYICGKNIRENFLKAFGMKSSARKGQIRSDNFNYEKTIYKDSNEIDQFEFDGKKKYIFALSDGKVKKLNKYDKGNIPSYFEQDTVVDDFAVSSKYIYTGDKKEWMSIWDPAKNSVINTLPLSIEDKTKLLRLPGLSCEEGDELDPEEDPTDRLVDIIVNDEYSELIVILKDELLFWQIPTIDAEIKLGRNISTKSSICFQEGSMTFMLNCENKYVMVLRQDSLKVINEQPLGDGVLLSRMTSRGEIYIAEQELELQANNPFGNQMNNANKDTRVMKIIVGPNPDKIEIFNTKRKITSMEVIYQDFVVNSDIDVPKVTIQLILDKEEIVLIKEDAEGNFVSKFLSKVKISDPQFMSSARDISTSNGPIETNNGESTDNNSYGDHLTPTGNVDMDKLDLMSTKGVAEKFPRYMQMQYSREMGYFIGYLEQVTAENKTAIHFTAYNPYHSKKKKIFSENILIENSPRKRNKKVTYKISHHQISKSEFLIIMNSSKGLIILSLDIDNGTIKKEQEIQNENETKAPAQIASLTNHLYIPQQNRLEIYDISSIISKKDNASLNKVFTLEFAGTVLDVLKGRKGDFIGVVDMNNLYIVDVRTMLKVRVDHLTNMKAQTKMIIMDMQFFDQIKEYSLPEFNQDVTMIKKLDYSKLSGLKYMPIDELTNCFSSNDNQSNILKFASFYSDQINMMNGYDYIFGPLNPFIFAIFFSEEDTLQKLMEQYTYPKLVSNFMTPIEFCLQNEENDCLRIVCSVINDNMIDIYLTRTEFISLLQKEFLFCHNLLALAPKKIPFDKMNFGENISDDIEIRFSDSFFDYMIENERKQYLAENEATPEETEEARQRIEIYYAPFKYEFAMGSEESLEFLNYYADTISDKFALSEWSNLVTLKWSSLKYLYAFNAVIFWIYMFFCTYSIIFNLEMNDDGEIIGEKHPSIRMVAIAFNVIVAFLEILQMIAYCFYDAAEYFGDFWNYIDIAALCLAFSFFMKLHEQATGGAAIFIALILLLLIYYRGFSYLRLFDSFTSMIGMINTIVGESAAFFTTLFYAYFVVFFLLIRVDPGDSILNKLRDAYIFSLFGGVEQDHFEAKYIFFPMVIGTMIVTIILLNVLIAFMSNIYDREARRQEITSMKEKASMLLDLEVYISLFKSIFEKIKKKYNDEEYRESQQKVTFFLKKIEGVTSSGGDGNFAKVTKMEADVGRLKAMLTNINARNDKNFASIKKKINGINKFFGYEQSEASHFDAKMQGLMISMFEEFGMNITKQIVNAVEKDFNLKRREKEGEGNQTSLLRFR